MNSAPSIPSCYRHPSAVAAHTCEACARPICAGCTVLTRARSRCVACEALKRRRRTRWLMVPFVLGSVGVALAGVYGIRRLPFPIPAEPSLDAEVQRARAPALRALLEREPCNREAAMQYALSLHAAEDAERTARFCDGFIQQCGPYPQLRFVSYQAHTTLGAFDLAVRDATELIDSGPQYAVYWSWRAQAHQSQGALDQALRDFREAFRLQPDQFAIASQLATALEHHQQPCEAARVLKAHQRAQPVIPLSLEAVKRIARLEAEGRCGSEGNGERPPPP